MNMWFTKLIKQFFFWVDKIVFNLISKIYDLLLTIARTSVLTQADIADMADRIYKLLAIFMIFKVTLSLITYVVNPDDFSDKSKGVGKLTTNIIISLAMLILTPYIFSYAYQIQTIILEDNSLATLIFGGNTEEENSFFNSAGDDMAYITMNAFITPNYSLEGLHECTDLFERNSEGKIEFNQTCYDALNSYVDGTNFTSTTLANYKAAIENNSLGLLLRQDLVLATAEDNTEFVFEYTFIFSTVVGVVVILLLITFCMDVAVRSLKLALLQLIAPVPILSYVDPKSGKDGMFKKWYEMCFKTYLSLFIRLLALYFAVYIISRVADLKLVDIVTGAYQTGFLLSIFIIIGALMFAKDLPKMLEGLGIKLDGGGKFFLNPLKKLEEQALGGKKIVSMGKGLAAAGLASGAAFATNLATTGSRFKNAKGFWGKTGALFSSVGGAIGAGRRGIVGAFKGEKFGKNFTNSYSGAMKAKQDRAKRNQQSIGAFERFGYKINQTVGGLSYTDKVKNQVSNIEEGKGDKTGFTAALKQKYGDTYGETRSRELEGSVYFKKSTKALETDKKTMKSKQEHIGSVLKGKDTIEALVSKDRGNVKAMERNVKAVEARTDADYISGKYGSLVQRYEKYMIDEGLADKYTDPATSDDERNKILSQLAAKARNDDRKVAKEQYDKEIAKTIVEDLSDPNEKAAANKVFGELKAEVLSTEDEELIKEFNKIVKFDADGNVLVEGDSKEEKTATMMKIIDAFGTGSTGIIRHNASRVNAAITSEASLIDDILDARNIQSSDLQNSEEARHKEIVANSVGSGK